MYVYTDTEIHKKMEHIYLNINMEVCCCDRDSCVFPTDKIGWYLNPEKEPGVWHLIY